MKFDKYEIILIKKLQRYNLEKQCKILSGPFNTNVFIILFFSLYLLGFITFKEFFYLGFSAVVVFIIKNIFKRKRPYDNSLFINNKSKINHKCGINKLDSYSFPSGHATISMVFYLILLNKYDNYIHILSLIPLLVGFSRIYLGVHYPSDVIAGFILGGIYFSLIKDKL